jgi:hypothetical protein
MAGHLRTTTVDAESFKDVVSWWFVCYSGSYSGQYDGADELSSGLSDNDPASSKYPTDRSSRWELEVGWKQDSYWEL